MLIATGSKIVTITCSQHAAKMIQE